MMYYKPTRDGGRRLKGETAFGAFDIEIDANNKVVRFEHHAITPPAAPPKESKPCAGCGGAKYDVRAHLEPGKMDEVIQGME